MDFEPSEYAETIRNNVTIEAENTECAIYTVPKELANTHQIDEKTPLTTASLFARFLARECWNMSQQDAIDVNLSTAISDYGTVWEIVVYQRNP